MFDLNKNLRDASYNMTRPVMGVAASGTRSGAKFLLDKWSLPVALGVITLMSVHDYEHEKQMLRDDYESEIAAKLDKKPSQVNKKDMETAAGDNKVLGEALDYSRTKRNASIAVNMLAFAASLFIAGFLAPHLAVFGIIGALAGGAATFGLYMGAEKLFGGVGDKLFGLNGPSVETVENDPSRQPELRAFQQVRYLERLQNRHITVEPEQVMLALAKANPEIDAQVRAQFGAGFAELAPTLQKNALAALEPSFHAQQLTRDINDRLIRPQELAYAAFQDNSGVPKRDTPAISSLQRTNEMLQAKLQTLGDQVRQHADNIREKSVPVIDAVKQKMPFGHANVAAVVPDNQTQAQGAMADRSGADIAGASSDTPTIGAHTGRVNTERQNRGQAAAMS